MRSASPKLPLFCSNGWCPASGTTNERTQLVQVIAAELGAPAELDNFNQVYMDVKRLRDKVSHAARFQSDGQNVLHITDS